MSDNNLMLVATKFRVVYSNGAMDFGPWFWIEGNELLLDCLKRTGIDIQYGDYTPAVAS